jgi:hypothetical protein
MSGVGKGAALDVVYIDLLWLCGDAVGATASLLVMV